MSNTVILYHLYFVTRMHSSSMHTDCSSGCHQMSAQGDGLDRSPRGRSPVEADPLLRQTPCRGRPPAEADYPSPRGKPPGGRPLFGGRYPHLRRADPPPPFRGKYPYDQTGPSENITFPNGR